MTLSCVVTETAPDPSHAVIWLHGLGADGHDFEPIVPELVAPDWPALRFVFPHAPMRPVTINNGMTMRAWYDIRALSLDERADAAGIEESVAQVHELIAAQNQAGIDSARILLAGFSQGGVVALHAGLRHRQALAGIVGLSCYLPLAENLAQARSPDQADTPLLLMHGSQDPVVAPALGDHARRTLEQWGYRPQWHSYPMQHQICMPQIAELRRWFGQRLAPAAED
ncbi:MAG: alpha/beta hydrolase [Xanthomonadales bacterium]|nr:alpha/beta hydrolase [Xanthomonadales bacterium]